MNVILAFWVNIIFMSIEPRVRTPTFNYGQFSLFLGKALSSLNSTRLIPVVNMDNGHVFLFQSTAMNFSYFRRENPTLNMQLNHLSLLFCFNLTLLFVRSSSSSSISWSLSLLIFFVFAVWYAPFKQTENFKFFPNVCNILVISRLFRITLDSNWPLKLSLRRRRPFPASAGCAG